MAFVGNSNECGALCPPSDCDSLALTLTQPADREDAFLNSQYVDDDDDDMDHHHGSMVIVKTHGRTTAPSPSSSSSDLHHASSGPGSASASTHSATSYRRGSMYDGFAATDLRRKSSDEGLGFPFNVGMPPATVANVSPARTRRDSTCEGFDILDRRQSSDTVGFVLQSILKSSKHLRRSEVDTQAHKDHLGILLLMCVHE